MTNFTKQVLLDSDKAIQALNEEQIQMRKAFSVRDPSLIPDLGKIPWRRNWPPIPVFLPGEPHVQRSLVGYSPWGHKEFGHDFQLDKQQQLDQENKARAPHIIQAAK